MSGAVWGLSFALFESTELDKGTARYVNHNLADYLVPVNADVPSIQVIMVPEHAQFHRMASATLSFFWTNGEWKLFFRCEVAEPLGD